MPNIVVKCCLVTFLVYLYAKPFHLVSKTFEESDISIFGHNVGRSDKLIGINVKLGNQRFVIVWLLGWSFQGPKFYLN